MFSDTHCHLTMMQERGVDIKNLLAELHTISCPFLLDAGTRSDDLPLRLQFANLAKELCGDTLKVFFSAGIWPDIGAAANRFEEVERLEHHLVNARQSHPQLVCAVGECGFDHHWNKNEGEIWKNEDELFQLQVELAKKMELPLIVHSREAFDHTYATTRNLNFSNGVIHCFSYGKKEAKLFLDEGWYISLSGAVTYCKKNNLDTVRDLCRYIPLDRLLLETDAPYLAPMPQRSKVNTPLLIEHTYSFVALMRGCKVEELASAVHQNALRLFRSSILQ